MFPNPLHRSHPCISYLISYHQTGKHSSKIVSHLHTWVLSVTPSAFLFFLTVTSLAPNGNSGTVRSYFVHRVCVCTEKSRAFSWAGEKKKKKKVNVTFPLGLQLSYRSTAEEGESTVQASVKVERVRLFPFVSFYHFIFCLLLRLCFGTITGRMSKEITKQMGLPEKGLV